MKKYALLVPLLFLLAGCSANVDSERSEDSASARSETPSPTPTPDVAAYCAAFYESQEDYVDFVLAAGDGDVDLPTYESLMDSQAELETLAPLQAQGMTSDYGLPLYEIADVVEAGGGDVNLSSGVFRDAAVEILEYCVSEGQSVG